MNCSSLIWSPEWWDKGRMRWKFYSYQEFSKAEDITMDRIFVRTPQLYVKTLILKYSGSIRWRGLLCSSSLWLEDSLPERNSWRLRKQTKLTDRRKPLKPRKFTKDHPVTKKQVNVYVSRVGFSVMQLLPSVSPHPHSSAPLPLSPHPHTCK